MNLKTIECFGFASTIKAVRLPFKGQDKNDSTFHLYKQNKDNDVCCLEWVTIGNEDLKLLKTLILNGDEHGKVMRGIVVALEITAPRYFFQELDTYKIGTERLSSESTMHCEAKGLSGTKLQEFKANIKEGLEQKRIYQFSYQTLRRIYFQRKNHRLPEWHEFCRWIEELPMANSLITIERKNEKIKSKD